MVPETQDDMGSTSDNSAGDWKTADVRKDTNEAGTSADAKTDEVELQDHDRARRDAAFSRRQFPRLGMDALLHESRPPSDNRNEDGSYAFYKVYKRRFFGLFQLTLLNVAVSWQWLTFSPVATTAAEFFHTDEAAINWLSTAALFAFVAIVPLVIYVLHWGPRPSILAASIFMLVGNWIRYAGCRAPSHSFGVVMFGQILIGFAQPFVLAAPTRYSDLWFTSRGRVAATALMSLANPFGAALGQLIIPFWVYSTSDIPNAVLYLAIIATVACVPSFFIPAKPPTPPCASGETAKLDLNVSARRLSGSLETWLILIPFVVYVGFFNSFSTIINQVMIPYGFSDTEAGIAGAVLIVVGLVSAAVTAPILDRSKAFDLAIKIAVPVIALCYLIFIWMPGTRAIAGPYVVLAVLGAASFSLLPVAVEYLVELTHPVSPEVTSTLAWAGGQLLGALFIIISNALKAGADANPPNNMSKALIFQAVVALVAVPFPMFLGSFGRGDKLILRRVQSDEARGLQAEQTESQDTDVIAGESSA